MIEPKNHYRNYAPEEVLQILREDSRLADFTDVDVDEGLEIRRDMPIWEWRRFQNLSPWTELYKAQNEFFKVNIPRETWLQAVYPEERELWDLCIFLSCHARKEVIEPVILFGEDCLNAGVFLTLRKNLANRGVDVEGLRPSTRLSDFVTIENFPHIVAEVVLTGVRTFDFLKFRIRRDISLVRKVNIFDASIHRLYLDAGSIRTFGDLARRIARELTRK